MKILFKKIALMTLLSFFVGLGMAQDFGTIGNNLKSGNTTELAKDFDSNVDVTILTNEDSYSKMQAEMVLKKFFSTHSPSSYKSVHDGTSGSGKYQIGELTTSAGTYRTYVYIKSSKIQEIRIEQE